MSAATRNEGSGLKMFKHFTRGSFALLGIVALGSCTTSGSNGAQLDFEPPATEANTHADAGSNSEAHVMSEKADLLEFFIHDERVLADSSNLDDSIDVSAFTAPSGRIAVYSDCVGVAHMTIALSDGVVTSRECRTSAEDAAHRDDLAVDAAGSYSVSVSMTTEQPWAVTVTELPPEVPE